MTSAQAHLNARALRDSRIDAARMALQIATVALLAACVIGGYSLITATLAAMPDIIAESAARRAW